MKKETKRKRLTRHDYFMSLAEMTAKRGTCDRALVGAVVVKNSRIIATGYNGSPEGMPHCDEVGHLMINNHCVRTVHAEQNAIIQAAKLGISIDGADIYITHKPCHHCSKILINAGIKKVYYRKDYDDGINDIYADKLEFIKM
jgi:dCMP deaminase